MNVSLRYDNVLAEIESEAFSGYFDIEIAYDLDAVLHDWEWLENNGIMTPFQKIAWLMPLYKTLAPSMGATPVLVMVRDTLTRRPVMLLPLCSRRYYGITIIEFADLGVSDYNAPILAKKFNPSSAQWQELWANINKALNKGSILWLKKMPPLIQCIPNPLVHYSSQAKRMDISSWGVALPATYQEYTTSVLQSTFAKELAKKGRRVAKRGQIEYAIAQTTQEKRDAFEVLARQRQVRCEEMSRSNNMAQTAYHQFYQSVAVQPENTLVTIGTYKVNGTIVGTVLMLNHQNALHIIVSTFEAGEWKSCSLGNVIMASVIEDGIKKGMRFFDLTIGNENYKQHFGTASSNLYYSLQPLTLIGSPAAIFMGGVGYIRRKVLPVMQKMEAKIRKSMNTKRNIIEENILQTG